MQIPVRCPTCKTDFTVETYYRGLIVACPECSELVKVSDGDVPTGTKPTFGSGSRTSDSISNGSRSDSWEFDENNKANDALASDPPASNSGDAKQLTYHVRTSDGSVYGAVSADTVLRWEREGRISEETSVRQDGLDFWVNYSTWKSQLPVEPKIAEVAPNSSERSRSPSEWEFGPRDVSSGSRGNGIDIKPRADIRPGDHNRFAGKKINGRIILVLAVLSWLFCALFPVSLIMNFFLIMYARGKLTIRLEESNLANNRQEFQKDRMYAAAGLTLIILLTCLQLLAVVGWMLTA